MNTFLHTEDELRASVEEGTRQVEAGQYYTDAQVDNIFHHFLSLDSSADQRAIINGYQSVLKR